MVVLLTQSKTVMIAVIFTLGCFSSIRICVGYNYMIEMMPKDMQVFAGTSWNVIEAVLTLFAVVYYWLISNNWLYYFLFCYSLHFLCIIICCYLPESPRFSLEIGNFEELR